MQPDHEPRAPYTRMVDKLVIHNEPLEPAELFEQLITERTRYLVLDLDRTIHLGINIGERLGWELCANLSYGVEHMEQSDSKRPMSRFFFDWSKPGSMLRYLANGTRLWAYPGLFYLLFGKIGYRLRWTRGLVHRYFGSEPVREVQEVPRLALMHHLTSLPLETIREITRRLWKRCEPRQVFCGDDFRKLKERFPQLTIIISSASPQPVLEVAQKELGIDGIIYTAISEHNGYLSSPPHHNPLFLLFNRPRHISTPEQFQQNASLAKRHYLLRQYPDFCDPGVETVGITDTSYGEDHDWANFCTRVVDVNSPTPFSPIVAADSPLTEIHSVRVLPKAERAAQTKHRASHSKMFERESLRSHLAAFAGKIETLTASYNQLSATLGQKLATIEEGLLAIEASIATAVEQYNVADGQDRKQALGRLRGFLEQQRRLQRKRFRVERPLSRLARTIRDYRNRTRSVLEAHA